MLCQNILGVFLLMIGNIVERLRCIGSQDPPSQVAHGLLTAHWLNYDLQQNRCQRAFETRPKGPPRPLETSPKSRRPVILGTCNIGNLKSVEL